MLKEKVALITGASRGIGRSIALKLSRNGAAVVVNYNNSADAAGEVVSMIEKDGGQAIAVQSDVSKFQEAGKLVKRTIDEFGRLDILINNAGINRDTLLLRMKEEDWDRVIEVNLKSVYNCSSQALKYMLKAKSGVIINMSSVVGLHGNPGQANYAASKAGIIGLSKSLAKEVASRGIRVNCLAPGFIDTEMTTALNEQIRKSLLEIIPLNRFGQPDDVAEAVLFLSSDNAAYITGQVISIDGGMNI